MDESVSPFYLVDDVLLCPRSVRLCSGLRNIFTKYGTCRKQNLPSL